MAIGQVTIGTPATNGDSVAFPNGVVSGTMAATIKLMGYQINAGPGTQISFTVGSTSWQVNLTDGDCPAPNGTVYLLTIYATDGTSGYSVSKSLKRN
jgi:hypothetical protein